MHLDLQRIALLEQQRKFVSYLYQGQEELYAEGIYDTWRVWPRYQEGF